MRGMGSSDRSLTTDALFEVRHVSKSFGITRALQDVWLSVIPGEVHGLLGMNGSGKSTLLKVLSGVVEPDVGAELVVRSRTTPLPVGGSYRRWGWGFVHQDLGLYPTLRVVDNLHLSGSLKSPPGAISWRTEFACAREILGRFNLHVDPRCMVGELRPSERARLAIVRALHEASLHEESGEGRHVLFLDESTVSLQQEDRRETTALIRQITEAGGAVVLVSHDLTEIRDLTDRVTVLRDGRIVDTAATQDLSDDEMLHLVVGSAYVAPRVYERVVTIGTDALSVEHLSGEGVKDATFACRRGEILGLSGLAGSGFEGVPYLLFGVAVALGGTVRVAGGSARSVRRLRPDTAIRLGISLVPGDRRTQGLAMSEPVLSNVSLATLARYRSRTGWLVKSRETREVTAFTRLVGVVPPDVSTPVSMLSGGNQQKALIAKWLNTNPEVLMLHEPTVGIDVPTRAKLQRLLREQADGGKAIICASGDFEQLADLCDRVLVFRDGRIAAELSGENLSKDRIAFESLGASYDRA